MTNRLTLWLQDLQEELSEQAGLDYPKQVVSMNETMRELVRRTVVIDPVGVGVSFGSIKLARQGKLATMEKAALLVAATDGYVRFVDLMAPRYLRSLARRVRHVEELQP